MRQICLLILVTLLAQVITIASQPHIPYLRPLNACGPDNVRVDPVTDCAIKELALQYATQLQGQFQPQVSQLVHDALELGTTCGLDAPIPKEELVYSDFFPTQLKWQRNVPTKTTKPSTSSEVEGTSPITLFVDVNSGSDSNPGTQEAPLASFNQAIRLVRFYRPMTGPISQLATQPATIYFRQGMYFFDTKMELGVRDSYITISAFNDEEVVFSGGIDLSGLAWSPFKGNVLVAPLPVETHITLDTFNELYVNGRRAVRSRYPDGNPETTGLWTPGNTGYIPKATAWTAPIPASSAPFNVTVTYPTRSSWYFPNYQLGVGGAANAFQPSTSFWASTNPPAGRTYAVPSGLTYDPSTWSNNTYADPSQAFIHTFHGSYWGGWVFQVADVSPATQSITFSRGGYQEARGGTYGAEFYIENVLEELDQPDEWWLDTVSGMLYYYPNNTDAMQRDANGFLYLPDNSTLIATQTPVILSVQGASPEELVESVFIQGITFAHASSTYMQPMEVPSGGDWSITRLGALRLEYVRNATVLECVFNGVGGNALVVSRTAWNTSIIANEFVWVGSSAILLVGELAGMDGSSRVTYPIGTFIHANLMHEMGIWVKQSSGVGQALAQATTIDANIIFNLARACINFNDGFGGGSTVSNNLLFNSVRETDDHGPFNSWDRQVYLQRRANGSVSIYPDQNFITHNFMLNNYQSVWPIDHDDGSQFYTDSENFLVYGGYKSYLGNSLTVHNNFYVLPDGKVDVYMEYEKLAVRTAESLFADDSLVDESDSLLPGLSSIMQARLKQMDQRYRIDKRAWEQRDERLVSGLPDDDDDESLTLSRNWGQFCAQDGGGFDHVWVNNTCTTLAVTDIYNLWVCDLSNLNQTIPFFAINNFYTTGVINITCGNQNLTWSQWQSLGYDQGSYQYPQASLQQIVQWGQQLFGLSDDQEETTMIQPTPYQLMVEDN